MGLDDAVIDFRLEAGPVGAEGGVHQARRSPLHPQLSGAHADVHFSRLGALERDLLGFRSYLSGRFAGREKAGYSSSGRWIFFQSAYLFK